MTDDKRLRDKLNKLATGGEVTGPDGRRLAAGRGTLLDAILDEIDETILARRLTFRASSGAELVLDASGRRLVRVVRAPVEPPGLTDPIGEAADTQIAALRAALDAFLEGAEELLVRADPLDDRPDAAAVGRSAEALATLLGGPAEPVPEARGDATIEAFLERLDAPDFLITEGGEPMAKGGDTDALAAIPEDLREMLLAEAASGDGPAAAILGAGGEGPAVLIGRAEGRVVVASVQTSDAGALARAWSATFG